MRKFVDGYALLIMVVLCLIWAVQQVALKGVAGQISPLTQVGIRSGVAALFLALLTVARRRSLLGAGELYKPGIVVGVLFALEFLFVGEGLKLTTASHMAVFLYTAPIFASLGLHWKLPDERLAKTQWAGILLAFFGVAVMFFAGAPQPDNFQTKMLLGDFLGLMGGFAWGCTTVVVRTTRLSDAPAEQTLFYQLVTAFALLSVLAWWKGETAFEFTPLVGWSLVFQGVVVCFLSYLTWFWLLTKYQASQLGVLTFLTPPMGVMLGVLLLGERLEVHFIVGTFFTLAGVLLVTGYGWRAQALARRRSGR